MGKTVLSVIVGYVVMVALVLTVHAILTSAWLLLLLGLVAAFIGGYVASLIRPGRPATYLALLIFVLSIPAFFMESASTEPLWYQLIRTALAPLAVLAGGCLRRSAPRTQHA